MKALIIGATGATGKDLLNILLDDTSVDAVDIFVRRDASIRHPKLTQHIVNFDKTFEWQHLVEGDVAFSCLGTTLKAAGSKQEQWKVDHDYQLSFALAAKENNVPKYALVSSANADPKSLFYYMKMKGALEKAVETLGFETTLIFQPGPLDRNDSDRAMERFGIGLVKFVNSLGMLKGQTPLPTRTLAQAMINAAKLFGKGIQRFNTKQTFELAAR